METKKLSTDDKARKINLDKLVHGTIAEIGAGQEVARRFFLVGGAANTVAKTMSAYDMAVSDAIYGPSDRYVSRRRLESMLEHEYELLLERLDAKRGAQNAFFAFADTVAARSYSRKEDGHGWLGVRFQTAPRSEPSDIVIHIRMFDRDNAREQEALGVVGVNLIYGAYYLRSDPDELIASLLDNLTRDRIEVDMIQFSGPAFHQLDSRLMSLKLVEHGLTEAAMFTSLGESVQPGEVLYGRPVLILRGNFRPVTNTIIDMLHFAEEQFIGEGSVRPVVLMEMTLRNLSGDSGIDPQDFLARAEILEALGLNVLITNLSHYHSVAVYLKAYKADRIGIVLGVPAVLSVFDEKYYTELEGGILEAFGRLFKSQVQMLAYPAADSTTGGLVTAANVTVAPQLAHLYRHLLENNLIVPIERCNTERLGIFPRDVLALIGMGDPLWESGVPPVVAKLIKERGYFGYRAAGS